MDFDSLAVVFAGSGSMSALGHLPELRALQRPQSLIRLPDQLDVPLSGRIRRLIDSRPLRRLAEIRQLGLVALVYPGATHSRFEHSLGVYRNALLFVNRLAGEPDFPQLVDEALCEALLVAALLHDVGHWPYCHPIEDMSLDGIPQHESLAAAMLERGELAELLKADWACSPDLVSGVLSGSLAHPAGRLVSSILSGPLDVDKIDYLYRDSLHAGVPYGRNFDAARLISSLCLNQARDGIAITSKGRTAAELLVCARYTMFSEVYWHHAVRSATAMLQRSFFELYRNQPMDDWWSLVDSEWSAAMRSAAGAIASPSLIEGLFGQRRALYKRWVQWSHFERPDLYAQIARRPYPWLVAFSDELASRLSAQLRQSIQPGDVLVDAPPAGLEIQFAVDVFDTRRDTYHALAEVSPVVAALAHRQFDEFVKQVRLYVAPSCFEQVKSLSPMKIVEAILREMPDVEGIN